MAGLSRRRSGERGQAMVMMVAAMAAIIALVAVIIDGGNLWSQQRMVQNGSDAAAEAGAVVLAEKLVGAAVPGGAATWDDAVKERVLAVAAANGVNVDGMYYTDICGIPLQPDGTAALNADNSYNLAAAAKVGGGFPTETATTPDCPNNQVGPPAGVLVTGEKTVRTYLAGAFGMQQVRVATNGTAVSGWLQGLCPASEGDACSLLPVTIPTSPIGCDNSGDPQPLGGDYINGIVYKIPLCKDSAGNVGWLDWTPPHGGTSELISEIEHPNNPPIDLPSWQYVSQAGNVNSSGVESAIRAYDGEIVLVPMFDFTCASTPDSSQVSNEAANYGCSDAGGHGQNNWYRMPSFAALRLCIPTDPACHIDGTDLYGAYIQGNNGTLCGVDWSGAGCLVGRFVNIIHEGTVSANGGGGTSPTKVVGVQLIK